MAEKLTDEQLAVIINAQEAHATSFADSKLSKDRAQALKYYLGEKFGNEQEGRSQVISTDVFEAVEGMLPALLEIFLSSNKLAECEPFGPEDEAEAKQQTEVANHIIFKQNNAALLFYTWFKDALIQKTGIVKTYYDTEDEYRIEQYAALTQEELMKIAGQDNVEPMEVEQYEGQLVDPQGQPVPVMLFRLKAKVRHKRDHIRIVNVPPENFLISVRQNTLDLQNCEFATHKERKTGTDLMEMGVEQDFLEECGGDTDDRDFTEESLARDIYNQVANRDPSNQDPSMREYWVSDGVIQIDTDGDGIAEFRHFIKIGNKVWLNEETDIVPFSVICPILLPHQFYGLSIADITQDVQLTKSVLWRQMLDNLYLTNNPQKAVLEGQVNLDDLLTSRPGGLIRERVPNAVRPIETPFVAKESFPMLEYWDSVKETRTGVTRYNQGLDADSLNKTAHGIQSILGQSLKRLEMIARLFAETGVKDLVRKVLHCVAKSGMKSVTVKLTNGYVHIDPREWKNQYNITINVGLGTGTKDRQLQMLAMVKQSQIELLQLGKGYMVPDEGLYNVNSKIAEAAGFRSPELFFTDPRMVPPEAKQAPPPIEILKLQQDRELKTLDMQVTSQQKDKDMANDRVLEQIKGEYDFKKSVAVAQITKAAQENTANISADTQKRTKMADAMLADHQMKGEAEMEVFKATSDAEAKEQEMKSKMMDEWMPQLIQAIQQGTQQNAEGFQTLAGELQKLQQMMLAPRKAVKDKKTGKTIGVEISGFGSTPVQ